MYLIDVTAEKSKSRKIKQIMDSFDGEQTYKKRFKYVIGMQYIFDEINTEALYYMLKTEVDPVNIDFYKFDSSRSYRK